jgi:hypothetical protein
MLLIPIKVTHTSRPRSARTRDARSRNTLFTDFIQHTLRHTSHPSGGPRNFDTLVFPVPAERSRASACFYRTRKTQSGPNNHRVIVSCSSVGARVGLLYIMRVTSTGPAIFKLHKRQAPHKVSCPEYFACVHTHCLALCILWRYFTLLPTTTPYPALYWLGRYSSRTPCEEGQTALLTTAGKQEGALQAPNLLDTQMSHHWSVQ